jgi:hypothetical protein
LDAARFGEGKKVPPPVRTPPQASRSAPSQFFSRSGDDDLDRALIAELKRIVRILTVNPGFKYINEMNAYVLLETIVEGTEGTVILGLPLIKSLLEKADGGAGVAGVCAHECAHIYQWRNKLDDKLGRSTSVMPRELHADFLGC